MNQIPDSAAERVLGTIREAIDLDDQGQSAEAARVLGVLVEEFPEASIIHSYLAWVLSRGAKHREAIEHGRVATRLSPESELSSIMLFRTLWSAKEHQQAFDEMKRFTARGHSEEYERMMQEWNSAEQKNEKAEDIQ
jgi:predicted Zn-dependent protease